MDRKFRVTEIFGPTFQGEGALIGQQSHFIRFAGCDYRCTWCDTKGSVLLAEILKPGNSSLMTLDEIYNEVVKLPKVDWVTLSGGNPALFILDELVFRLQACDYKVAVETQGSVDRMWLRYVDFLTLSPKPPSAGTPDPTPILDQIINGFTSLNGATKLCIKVPCHTIKDVRFVKQLYDEYEGIRFYIQPVWIEGDDRLNHLCRLRVLGEAIQSTFPSLHSVTLLPQMHKLIGVR